MSAYGGENDAILAILGKNTSGTQDQTTSGKMIPGIQMHALDSVCATSAFSDKIAAIRSGAVNPDDDGERRENHANEQGYLPGPGHARGAGPFREYHLSQATFNPKLKKKGDVRLVHDSASDIFYVTLSHYAPWPAVARTESPFFRVDGTPAAGQGVNYASSW